MKSFTQYWLRHFLLISQSIAPPVIMGSAQFAPQYEPQDALVEDYRLLDPQGRSVSLPDDWPESIVSPMAWTAEDLGSRHIFQLTKPEMSEIQHWVHEYSDSKGSIDAVNNETAVLPLLQERLVRVRQSLHTELGLAVLRGFDPSCISMRENLLVLAAVASHVSSKRAAQSGGKIVVHMTDLATTPTDRLPAPYSNSILPFHTDPGADVVAMYVLKPAAMGGNGTFSSVSTIYNSLAASYPDLLRELGKPSWPFNGVGAAKNSYSRRPVIFIGTFGEPEMFFSRGSLIKAPHGNRSPGIPDLTRLQCIALDALHFTAESTACTISYQMGDIVFFNNRRLLHGREGFNDDLEGDMQTKRHILRLWLQDEEMSGLPPEALITTWKRTSELQDSYTNKENESLRWPCEPDRR
ncbi:hypothetical protein F5Y16DRAFT_378291 [Xylariaceae sp. FL0255]|nr:hypothetical protein F5Y16DRAFT_378291 [Xylariaceae sp. FL0255]